MWILMYLPVWKERACNYGYANMKAMQALLVSARFMCWLSAEDGVKSEQRDTEGEKEKKTEAHIIIK